MIIFSSVCSNRGEISDRFTVMKFLYIIVILFLHCCRLTCEMKSHHRLTSSNFNPGWNSPPYNPPLGWSFLWRKFSNSRKRLHLRYLTGFWMCLCCVRDIYLSVNFPTQHFLLLSCLWWFKALFFFNFPDFPWNLYTCTLATNSYWKHWWHLLICSYIIEGQKL